MESFAGSLGSSGLGISNLLNCQVLVGFRGFLESCGDVLEGGLLLGFLGLEHFLVLSLLEHLGLDKSSNLGFLGVQLVDGFLVGYRVFLGLSDSPGLQLKFRITLFG